MNFDVGLTTYDTDVDNDGVADGFDSCPDTPEGEEVDNNGCGRRPSSQRETLSQITTHLTTGLTTQRARSLLTSR